MRLNTTTFAIMMAALLVNPINALAHHEASHSSVQTQANDLAISGVFARATLPNQPVAGGYVTIANNGSDDRLVSAQSPAAGEVEIHEMAMQDGTMIMRQLPDGLHLPAGETVELKPGGYHLMFMDLTGPFVAGETVNITLNFEHAGEITLDMPIVALNLDESAKSDTSKEH